MNPHTRELCSFVEDNLEDEAAVIAGVCALLSDQRSYEKPRGNPTRALIDCLHELCLTFNPLTAVISPREPGRLTRAMIDGRFTVEFDNIPVLRDHGGSYEYEVCISFAGQDRAVAEAIADAIRDNGMNWRVFYDYYEETTLWGAELFETLHARYSRQSMFCIILFSRMYAERAWTRHELRSAYTRVLADRRQYVLPVALEGGVVPSEFSTVGHWNYKPGDEAAIATAVEDKVNEHAQRYYFPLDELAESISVGLVKGAVATATLKAARGSAEHQLGLALATCAAIIAADTDALSRPVRGLLDLVLFGDGPISRSFDAGDRVSVTSDAHLRRHLGREGPLLLSKSGWDEVLPKPVSEVED